MNMFILVAVIVIFLALTTYLGYRGMRNTRTTSDYLVGGRSIHPYVMAMSYGATFISTSAIIGFGGIAALYGMSMLYLAAANIVVGIFIAFVLYGKRTRRMGLNLDAHTFPEFLARRVDSRFIQFFGGGVIFLLMPIYAAAVLIGAARLMEGLLHIPYVYSVTIFAVLVAAYVIMGGLKGVMYTDALQGSLMLGGMLLLLVVVYSKLGGILTAHRTLTEMAALVPPELAAQGHQGWTAAPKLGSPIWWTVFSSLLFGVGVGVLAQPQLVVRYMTVKSDRELNRGVLIGGLFILITVGTPYVAGPLANVFYFQSQGKLAVEMALGNPDSVIPILIRDIMPSWFGYVFLLVILSAGMSTLSSQFHTVGTAISRDFYQFGIHRGKKMPQEILVARTGIVISILLTVLLGYNLNAGMIARATSIFFGLMAAGFLAPYTAALYWKRLTRRGAIAGILSGFAVSGLGFLFLHEKEAAFFGLARALTGRPTLLGGSWGIVDPLVYALPVSIFFTILISLLTKVENPGVVEKSFEGIK
ncbi:MAG: sodium:solute symporter family protein [Spirochaetales bacterium]|jgi:SSS family solute:Na+ symporter|nr:sodium:solute symporter family protein [Spirochaetales bacterium]